MLSLHEILLNLIHTCLVDICKWVLLGIDDSVLESTEELAPCYWSNVCTCCCPGSDDACVVRCSELDALHVTDTVDSLVSCKISWSTESNCVEVSCNVVLFLKLSCQVCTHFTLPELLEMIL